MERARAENVTTIASIFVNPRQFNEAADYQRYPRNEARDLTIVEEQGIEEERRATRELGLKLIEAPMLPWVSNNEGSLEKLRVIARTSS